jgi:hypothetical protein
VGHPVFRSHKCGGLVLQLGGWAWGLKPPPHKNPVVREYKESYDPYQAVMPKMMTRKMPPTIKGNLKKYLKQIFVEKCNKAAYKNKIITYFLLNY